MCETARSGVSRAAPEKKGVVPFLFTLSGISTAGLFELPFANLSNVGTGGNVNAAKRIFLRFNLDADEQVSISNFYVGGDTTTAPVPEPASVALLGLGLCAAALLRKRRSA